MNSRGKRKNLKGRKQKKIKLLTIVAAVAVVVVVVFLLVSCREHQVGDMKLTAGQSAIYMKEDGSVVYGVAEKFDNGNYDKSDLRDKIDAEVEDFNFRKASSVDAMELDYFKVSSGVAKAIFMFDTAEDFSEYMNEYNRMNDFVEKDKDGKTSYEFYVGKIKKYQGKIKAKFISPDKKDTAKADELEGNMLMVFGNYQIQIDGTISYVSDNCTVKDGIVTTEKNENSYIIYALEK